MPHVNLADPAFSYDDTDLWSNIVVPSATAYPDSDKVGIWTGVGGENVMVVRSSHVDYYHGETG